jgi:hypothetical protein
VAGEEFLVLVVSSVVALGYWCLWFAKAVTRAAFPVRSLHLLALVMVLLVCLGLLFIVLNWFAAVEVRGHLLYMALFAAMGLVTLAAVNGTALVFGLSALDDALERRNPAATWAIGGLWLATTLCVCGANIGEGPTIGTTLGPLVLAVASLLALWAIFAGLTGNTWCITVDRDVASGMRLAGLLAAWGLILGRAVAGDWVSTEDTLRDAVLLGWPTFVLLLIAVVWERTAQPKLHRPRPSIILSGLLPAGSFLGLAGVLSLGLYGLQ